MYGLPMLGDRNDEDYRIGAPGVPKAPGLLPQLVAAFQRLDPKAQNIIGMGAQNVVAKGREETPSGNFFESKRWKRLSPVLLSVGARLLDNSQRYSRTPSGPLAGVGQAAVHGVQMGRRAEMQDLRSQFLKAKLAGLGKGGQKVGSLPYYYNADGTVNQKRYKQYLSGKKGIAKAGSSPIDISVGGPTPLTRGSKGAVQSGIMSMDDTVQRLGLIRQSWRPEYSTYYGGGKGWLFGKFDKAGVGLGTNKKEFLEGYSAWITQQRQYFLAYRKWVTGVAGGPKEFAEIRATIPSEDDGPTGYKAKMDKTVLIVQQLRERHFAAQAKGLTPKSPAYKAFLREHPLPVFGGKPSVPPTIDDLTPAQQQRLDELRKKQGR